MPKPFSQIVGKNMIQIIKQYLEHPAFEKISKVAQFALLIGLCVYLFARLSDIGWEQVITNLPVTPWFYLIFLLNFLLLPASELLIYRPLWPTAQTSNKEMFLAFMRKQALNEAVIGYSGEAFFYFWGRNKLGIDSKTVFAAIKDNNILSAAVSAIAAMLIVVLFAVFGELQTFLDQAPAALPYIVGTIGVTVLLVPLLALFGKKIIQISASSAARVAALHFGRICLFESLLVLQWSLVLPTVSIGTWIGFVAAKMVLTRIPLMPNKELMLLSLAVTLSEYVEAPEAALASLFLTATALSQSANVTVFVLTSLRTLSNKNTKA